MISRSDFERYCRLIASITSQASSVAQSQIRAWMAANPDADVAATREAAIEILDGGIQASSDAAASAAAEWYDELVAVENDLPDAITETVYDRDAVSDSVHYMAKHLVDGDVDGFLKLCGSYAEDVAKRSANQTIMRNAGRDKKSGVRFARIPTGAETCSFCYMLAGRGAVYLTRETAGELGQYHHHCDCKVVPGMADDKDAELVEGWKPDEARERLAQIEREAGASVGDKWQENDLVTRSMKLRDKDWLYYGKVPEPDYSLVPRSAYGTLKSKDASFDPSDYDLSNFLNEKGKDQLGNEWRDLFVHDALANAGIKVVPRPTAIAPSSREDSGITSPDVSINGTMWEIKSPQPSKEPVKPGNELKFIKAQFRSAHDRNFKNPLDVETGVGMGDMSDQTRLIISTRYRHIAASEEDISAAMKQFVGSGPGKYAVEAIWVDADGVIHIYS